MRLTPRRNRKFSIGKRSVRVNCAARSFENGKSPSSCFARSGQHFLAGNVGAEEGTRTPTAFRPPAPKAGASANSATSACAKYITALTPDCACPRGTVLLGSAASGVFPRGKKSWHIARSAGRQWRTARPFARLVVPRKGRRRRQAQLQSCHLRRRRKWTKK